MASANKDEETKDKDDLNDTKMEAVTAKQNAKAKKNGKYFSIILLAE